MTVEAPIPQTPSGTSDRSGTDKDCACQIKDRGWWQGSVVPDGHLRSKSPTLVQGYDFWVLATQTCNLYNDNFDAVHSAEWVGAKKIERLVGAQARCCSRQPIRPNLCHARQTQFPRIKRQSPTCNCPQKSSKFPTDLIPTEHPTEHCDVEWLDSKRLNEYIEPMNKPLAPGVKDRPIDLIEVNGRYVVADRSINGFQALAVTFLRCLGMAFLPFWVRHLPQVGSRSHAFVTLALSTLYIAAGLAQQLLYFPDKSSIQHAIALLIVACLIGLLSPRLAVASMAISAVVDTSRIATELVWGAAPAVNPVIERWPFAAWEYTAFVACAVIMAFDAHQRTRAEIHADGVGRTNRI